MIGILAGLLLGNGIIFLIFKEYAEGICLILAGLLFTGLIFISNGGLL